MNGGPRRFRPFGAEERPFAGHAFSPTVGAFAMHGQQKDAAIVGPSKARLKEMDERHLDLAECDGFDFHDKVMPFLVRRFPCLRVN